MSNVETAPTQGTEAAPVDAHSADAAGHAAETVGEGADAVAHGGGHGGEFDIGEMLAHHMVNSQELTLPFVGDVHLPTYHLFGLEIAITKHLVWMWIASALLILLVVAGAWRAKKVPGKGQSILELLVLFVRDEIAIPSMGEEDGRRWTPYLLTTFFFVLLCNSTGLVPYGASATANISVTAALALATLVLIHASGMVRFGIFGHWKNFMPSGLPVWMLPVSLLLFVIEILGTGLKAMALCIRLFGNMIAGHMVILSFLGLIFLLGLGFAPVSVALALFNWMLELLIVPLQAFVFTQLTALFIGMSLHPH